MALSEGQVHRTAYILAAFSKRLLDNSGFYQKLFTTPAGQELQSMADWKKWLAEFGLYFATAVADEKSQHSGALVKFLAEISEGVASEVAKQIHQKHMPSFQVSPRPLTQSQFEEFTRWFTSASPEEKKAVKDDLTQETRLAFFDEITQYFDIVSTRIRAARKVVAQRRQDRRAS